MNNKTSSPPDLHKATVLKTNQLLQQLKQISRMPIENEALICDYLKESLVEGIPITFFNWECPPRFIDTSDDGIPYINYAVDIKKIGQGFKIDEFTEIPRVVEKQSDEIKILDYLRSVGLKFKFIKIIADTNARFLTPVSLKILGETALKQKYDEFKRLIEKQTASYPTPCAIYLFWELLGDQGLVQTYTDAFNYAYTALGRKEKMILDEAVVNRQMRRTREHVGIQDTEWVQDFSLRTIATYGAEGVVFDKLSQGSKLTNCVWLNIEEVDRRTIQITNFLRRQRGLGNLPMIFPDL